jgi:hypothetical protein
MNFMGSSKPKGNKERNEHEDGAKEIRVAVMDFEQRATNNWTDHHLCSHERGENAKSLTLHQRVNVSCYFACDDNTLY